MRIRCEGDFGNNAKNFIVNGTIHCYGQPNLYNQVFNRLKQELQFTGGNLRTAADLWRFNFLFKNGGLYCDWLDVVIKVI